MCHRDFWWDWRGKKTKKLGIVMNKTIFFSNVEEKNGFLLSSDLRGNVSSQKSIPWLFLSLNLETISCCWCPFFLFCQGQTPKNLRYTISHLSPPTKRQQPTVRLLLQLPVIRPCKAVFSIIFEFVTRPARLGVWQTPALALHWDRPLPNAAASHRLCVC